jgi:hypothetical protein
MREQHSGGVAVLRRRAKTRACCVKTSHWGRGPELSERRYTPRERWCPRGRRCCHVTPLHNGAARGRMLVGSAGAVGGQSHTAGNGNNAMSDFSPAHAAFAPENHLFERASAQALSNTGLHCLWGSRGTTETVSAAAFARRYCPMR